MKRYLLFCVLCVGLMPLPGRAGVVPPGRPVATAAPVVAGAVGDMLLRCLPGVVGAGPLRTAGLVPAPAHLTHRMLKGQPGSVWLPPVERDQGDVMMVLRDDLDLCRVVAAAVPAHKLSLFVRDVFGTGGPSFHRQFFARLEDGGFRAQYRPEHLSEPVRILVSAKYRGGIQAGYAIFTILEKPADL